MSNTVLQSVQTKISNIRESFSNKYIQSIIFIITFIPKLCHYYVLGDSISYIYWTLHIILLSYVYGAGSLVYQIHQANTVVEYVKNYCDMSIFILISNITYTLVARRNIMKEVIDLATQNDDLVSREEKFDKLHIKYIRNIKIFVLAYLFGNYWNDFLYALQRSNMNNTFGLTLCPGMEPLDVSPNREICTACLIMVEINIGLIVTTYHSTYIFLMGHTTAMYNMLTAEIMEVNKEPEQIKLKLVCLIQRHAVVLKTAEKLKLLYSAPIGIDFTSDAILTCSVLFVPFEEFSKLIFVLLYSVILFFLYCFLSQRLTNAAENFATAVYICGWENMDPKEKKMIYVMLRQAQKPVFLLAAGIVPVNLYTFAATCQSIYKFVTVMKF